MLMQVTAPAPSLAQLFAGHQGKVSDKWSLYLDEYERLLAPFRERPIRLLEIGVQNGGSLEIWAEYFRSAERLVGCDINPQCDRLTFGARPVSVIVGDINEPQTLAAVLAEGPSFDIIIDDGSHRSGDIVRAFTRLFPHLKEDGLYIVEDLHCGYWESFEGGLHDPCSSIAFFKRLADVLNLEHWRERVTAEEHLRASTDCHGVHPNADALHGLHSVTFLNSLCVLQSAPVRRNRLGERRLTGRDDSVVPADLLRGAGPSSVAPPAAQSSAKASPDEQASTGDIPAPVLLATLQRLPDDQARARFLENLLGEHARERQALVSSLAQCRQARRGAARRAERAARQYQRIASSRSWRLTAPLRWMARALRRLVGTIVGRGMDKSQSGHGGSA